MKIISVAKASPIGNQEIENVQIFIEGEAPYINDLAVQKEFYRGEAHKIAVILIDSLPNATLISSSELYRLRLIRKLESISLGFLPIALRT